MLPLVNDAYLELQPYVPGRPLAQTMAQYGLRSCIKLASNENCFGPSPLAQQAMHQAVGDQALYPDANATALKEALAAHLQVGVDELLLGNGSNEIIDMVVRTCVRPGETMLQAEPAFVAYRLAAQALGVPLTVVPLRGSTYDLPALLEATTDQTKVVFIANPNNPTGTYVSAAALHAFLLALPAHVLVVMDEAYLEYADAPDYPNALCLRQLRERLLVMRTFSKAYGLAGLRVGYAVGQPALIDWLNRGRAPFNTGALAQAACVAALHDGAHVRRSRTHNTTARAQLSAALQARGAQVVPSQGNFVLAHFSSDGAALNEALLRQGVIVRPMQGYNMPHALRISVGTPAQCDRLVQALDQVLPSLVFASPVT